MASFFNFFSGMNNATDIWSGAIDIIVVKQPDGELKSTPFHVRFGRLKVVRSREKTIRIMINGQLTDLKMKIGELGECFFVHPADGPISKDLSTSPIQSPVDAPSSPRGDEEEEFDFSDGSLLSLNDSLNYGGDLRTSTPPSKRAVESDATEDETEGEDLVSQSEEEEDEYEHGGALNEEGDLLSSASNSSASHYNNRLNLTPIRTNDHQKLYAAAQRNDAAVRNATTTATAAVAADTTTTASENDDVYDDEDDESKSDLSSVDDTGPLKTQSNQPPPPPPSGKWSRWFGGFGGWSKTDESSTFNVKQNDFIEQRFLETLQNKYKYDAKNDAYSIEDNELDANLLNVENILLDTKARTIQASPNKLGQSRSVSNSPVRAPTVGMLSKQMKQAALSAQNNQASENNNYTPNNKVNDVNTNKKSTDDSDMTNKNRQRKLTMDMEEEAKNDRLVVALPESLRTSNFSGKATSLPDSSSFENFFENFGDGQKQFKKDIDQLQERNNQKRKNSNAASTEMIANAVGGEKNEILSSPVPMSPSKVEEKLKDTDTKSSRFSWSSWLWYSSDTAQTNSDVSSAQVRDTDVSPTSASSTEPLAPTRYQKSLRPLSSELKSLNLKDGKNTISFLVTSRILGTQEITAEIYLWDHKDEIVVSDVDGTITRSDALGHILPIFGKDWSHIGITELYKNIEKNGYRLMYLTSRSIIQSGTTKRYLKSVKQNGFDLPDGPMVCSPGRLFECLTREVIMRKPEEFKIAALKDIKTLFVDPLTNKPYDTNDTKNGPFYAGFGNRITDLISYRAVAIPAQMIFTVDHTGKIVVFGIHHAGYASVRELVEYMFPGTAKQNVEYNEFNYWQASAFEGSYEDDLK